MRRRLMAALMGFAVAFLAAQFVAPQRVNPVAHDVDEGREYVNYSDWNKLTPEKQAEMLHESWEHVAEGDMPPRSYLLLHRQARLSEQDRQLLRTWAAAAAGEEW